MTDVNTSLSAGARRAEPSNGAPRTIVLLGMMGVGKTTIGRRLAPPLGLKFYDADEEVEKAAGMSVSALFEKHGEESFRRGEAQVIERLLDGPPIVLALGGGAFVNDETRALILEKAISIWLKADIDTLVARTALRGGRPLLKNGDPREILQRLMQERAPYYQQADLHIESGGGAHSETVQTILSALSDRGLPKNNQD